MSLSLLLVILSAIQTLGIEGLNSSDSLGVKTSSDSDAPAVTSVEVGRFDFNGERADINYDRWPDGWKRRLGRGYPRYQRMALVKNEQRPSKADSSTEDRCIRVELDGAASAAFSPPVSVASHFSYLLTGWIKTEDLHHDSVYYSLKFLPGDGGGPLVVEVKNKMPPPVHRSARVTQAPNWRRVEIGPVVPPVGATVAIVGIHVTPGDRADLTGAAMFDEIVLSRLPRMTLDTAAPYNVFAHESAPAVTCRLSGILDKKAEIEFELLGHDGVLVRRARRSLSPEIAHQNIPPNKITAPQATRGFAAAERWELSDLPPGFYRLRANVHSQGAKLQRETTLVIAAALARPGESEFGWSLTRRESSGDLDPLAPLLAESGAGWVKMPVWSDPDDHAAAERTAWFAERLGARGVTLVGVLDRAPVSQRSLFGGQGDPPIARVFEDPAVWRGALDPVMTRLSLKIHYWQLGDDDDASFVHYPQLERKILQIKQQLDQFGQEMHLCLPWRWLFERPATRALSQAEALAATGSTDTGLSNTDAQESPRVDPPWKALAYSVEPPFTPAELDAYLNALPASLADRWINFTPLSRRAYDFPTRALDLVEKMVTARIHDAPGMFLMRPFDDDTGLMHTGGGPSELFLAWRTAAMMTGGARYEGSLQLPGKSRNHVFARDGQAIMVLWSDHPVEERVYLGENAKVVDLWGQQHPAPRDQGRHVLSVGQLPIFVTGVHLPIARMRIAFAFDRTRLASVFGRRQRFSCSLVNSFEQGVSGKLTLHTPKVWETTPRQTSFKLARGARSTIPFETVFGLGATTGPQPVRVDFEITANGAHRFSVWRTLQVGLGNLRIEVTTSMNSQGELIVRQQFENQTDEFVDFNCLLFAPGRRRMRKQIIDLGRGRHTTQYILPQGAELVGKTLSLRAEEINGDRILNYRVRAEP